LSLAALFMMVLGSCDRSQVKETGFTKADSLTETYLALQDTMLQVWNTMMHDDNRKLVALEHLLHELYISDPERPDEIQSLEKRLADLKSLRYDQETMSDTEVVSEYDFASNSLVTELIALVESRKEFAYNTTLQKLVDNIRGADQRVNNYRAEYDRIASEFNDFIDSNKGMLRDLEEDSGLSKKPLFEVAAE